MSAAATQAPARPVLRYFGAKWRLAPWIMSHFPAHRSYCEPYGGGASVLMRKPRSSAEVYNDLDGDVVNVFRVLRDPESARELERLIRLTPFARHEFRAAYAHSDDPIEQARRVIVRSLMGFGSGSMLRRHVTGFRSVSDRSGTRAAHDWANYPGHIASFTARLTGVVIEERDALELMGRHDGPDTLHYVDPPYPHSTRADHRRHKYTHDMADDDHRRLAGALQSVSGMVVLSGYACGLYDRELYPDWARHEIQALAGGARRRIEVVWLNPACSRALEREREQGCFADQLMAVHS